MWFVYILKSFKIKNWIYVGSTNNLEKRIRQHKKGESKSTKPYLPIVLNAYIAVKSESKARELEKYLKFGSGKAFMKRHFIEN
ncbi:GIY-YIG nuclease family protein [Patescibacteria group bacterium]|nr:GIY-YIG nuclease family protein [Patescibacteria group bacterium]